MLGVSIIAHKVMPSKFLFSILDLLGDDSLSVGALDITLANTGCSRKSGTRFYDSDCYLLPFNLISTYLLFWAHWDKIQCKKGEMSQFKQFTSLTSMLGGVYLSILRKI